jgi:hypothetical protein
MEDITPASVMTGFWRWFGVGILGIALIVAAVFGGRKARRGRSYR